ncbi:hypothetical protein [Mycobacterium persicum]|uniref:hypothetical protein n=1 Tax=Mycobacterium persicum TaxID=1487726 RepID=UPI00115CACB9|nr:hypothetical protein [Mycobacterium persicum]
MTRTPPGRACEITEQDRPCWGEIYLAGEGLGGFDRRTKRSVEAVPGAPVAFMVGVGSHEPDQLPEVVCIGQHDSAVGVGAAAKHQAFSPD